MNLELAWPLVQPVKRLSKEFRCARNVLLMVQELHSRGYQHLRIVPGISNTGLSWRCGITPADNIYHHNGALAADFDSSVLPQYTSASGTHYFDWQDAETDKPIQLAEKFLRRFPTMAERGVGMDFAYAGWFSLVLGVTAHGVFPVAFGEWLGRYEDTGFLPTFTGMQIIPMPPGGKVIQQQTSL